MYTAKTCITRSRVLHACLKLIDLRFTYLRNNYLLQCPNRYQSRYRARNNAGQIGLVPRNYLQELTEYLAQPYRGCPQGNDSIDRRNDQLPPPPNNANHPERPNLVGKSWYYGAITRNQCDTVLNSHGHDGDYLIRDSETNVSKSYLCST